MLPKWLSVTIALLGLVSLVADDAGGQQKNTKSLPKPVTKSAPAPKTVAPAPKPSANVSKAKATTRTPTPSQKPLPRLANTGKPSGVAASPVKVKAANPTKTANRTGTTGTRGIAPTQLAKAPAASPAKQPLAAKRAALPGPSRGFQNATTGTPPTRANQAAPIQFQTLPQVDPGPYKGGTNKPSAATGGSAQGAYDVVLYNKFGSVTHHPFQTKAAADQFAAAYRQGVYSLQDGVIKKIEVNRVAQTSAQQSGGSSGARIGFDDSVPKGQKGATTPKSSGTSGNGQVKTATSYVGGKARQIQLTPIGNGKYLRADAATAFQKMQAAAQRAGIDLTVNSAFRSNEQQQALYDLYQAGKGNKAARPGYSNHQGGVALDLQVDRSFSSKTYLWLKNNASQFGFTNTEGKRVNEPHHWVYAGTPI